MRRVVIESPYAGDTERNVAYALLAMSDCMRRNEAPLATHVLYTQFLDDRVAEQRALGMTAGFAWGDCGELRAVYGDLGISGGMAAGIARAHATGQLVEERRLFVRCCDLLWVADTDAAADFLRAHGAEHRRVGAGAPLRGACRQCREKLPPLPAPKRIAP